MDEQRRPHPAPVPCLMAGFFKLRPRIRVPLQPLRRAYISWHRRLRMDLWFPQLPLACAVGGAGMFTLLPAIRRYSQEYLHLNLGQLLVALHPISGHLPRLILAGVPEVVIGLLQVLIALGLVARSRIAWLSALGMTVAELALSLHTGAAQIGGDRGIYLLVLLAALFAARRSFDRSSLAAGTLFAVASILVLMIYGILGSLLLGGGFAPEISNLPQAFYFVIVTMATVGYGDIVPRSEEAQLFVASLIILGIAVFATALSALVGPVVQHHLNRTLRPRRARMQRVNHFIITGKGALARNTARELRRRGAPVVVITDAPEGTFGDAEVIAGDPTELETLRAAGAEQARAVLALSDDDSENAFVVLAVRELPSDAKKVAAVSSGKNLERLRRVHPDMIMTAQVLAGELLAMALTEEKIDGAWVLSRFLDVRQEES